MLEFRYLVVHSVPLADSSLVFTITLSSVCACDAISQSRIDHLIGAVSGTEHSHSYLCGNTQCMT